MSKPSNTATQVLPSKEATLFRQAVQSYEDRNFKKGVKCADQILMKYPDHGETLAVKGILLGGLKRREEAYELVKKGVQKNLNSHITWHIYGLLYREDKKYTDAIKCYLMALRSDPDNRNILRDLALLQLQVRDLAGFLETRRNLLGKEASGKINWYAFAFANHMTGNNAKAVEILDGYTHVVNEAAGPSDVEAKPVYSYDESEMLLYKALILEQSNNHYEAINILNDNESKIYHKTKYETTVSQLHLKNHDYDKALSCFLHLLQDNPNNYVNHNGFQMAFLKTDQFLTCKPHEIACLSPKMTDEQRFLLYPKYVEFMNANPQVPEYIRFCLMLSPITDFKSLLEQYLNWGIQRATPALFTELRPIIKLNTDKSSIIFETMKQYHEYIVSNKKIPGCERELSNDSILSSYIMLGAYYDYQKQYEDALEILDAGLKVDEQYVDLGFAKASVLKHQNKLEEAAEFIDIFRQFDLADRFINNKTVKYYLRCNNIEKATELEGLFTKKEVDINVDLFTMQCSWFELECAAAYVRLNNFPMALKKYHAILEHFNQFVDDQFDFFAYCIRKSNVEAFYQLCQYIDHRYQTEPYIKAVLGCCKCYLYLSEHPVQPVKKPAETMTPEELKAAKEKERKEAKLAEKKKKEEEKNKTKKKKDGDELEYPPDKDPQGLLIASVDDPLYEAQKLLNNIEAVENLEKDLLGFDIGMKRNKVLMAMKSLKNAIKNNKSNTEVQKRINYWISQIQSNKYEGLKADVITQFSTYLAL